MMRALGSGEPRGTSGEKEGTTVGYLYSLSVAHLIVCPVWSHTGIMWLAVENFVAASALLKQFCRLQGQKEFIANLSLGCSCNSEESLWQVTGALCCVVEVGAQNWLQALVKILLASWPSSPKCNRAVAWLSIHFIYTDHFQSRLTYCCTIIGHKASHSLGYT